MEVGGEEGPDGLQQHDAIERLETPEHPVSSRQLSEILFRIEDWNRMMSKRGRPSMNQALLLDLDKAVTAWGGLPKTTERSRRTVATITQESQVVRNQFSAMAMDEILQEQQQDLKNGFEGLGGIDMDIAFEVVFFGADWRKKVTFLFFEMHRGGAQEQQDDSLVSGQEDATENPQDAFLQRLNALNLQPRDYALHLVQDSHGNTVMLSLFMLLAAFVPYGLSCLYVCMITFLAIVHILQSHWSGVSGTR